MASEVVFADINQHMKKTIIKSTNSFVIYQVLERRDANKSWGKSDSLSAEILKGFAPHPQPAKLDGSILY